MSLTVTYTSFPPTGPTTMTQVISSYLYVQYNDDPSLQAFVQAQNTLAQNFLDTVNGLNLPIYVQAPISGLLLDWVGQGVYGLPRQAISSGQSQTLGPYGTYSYAQIGLLTGALDYGSFRIVPPQNIAQMTDDVYRRVLTWHFMKGDGKYFTVKWLKKRVMRFCTIANGYPANIDQTNQISVTFGANYQVTIRFIDFTLKIISGAIYGFSKFSYGSFATYGGVTTKTVQLVPIPNRQLFADCVQSGILELPFQFTWSIEV